MHYSIENEDAAKNNKDDISLNSMIRIIIKHSFVQTLV